jgi:hypothetical protein
MDDPFEKLELRIDMSRLKYYSLVAGCASLMLVKFVPGSRNIFPEPFDIFDHTGNITSALLGCSFSVRFGTRIIRRKNLEAEQNTSSISIKTKMVLGGFAAGVLANGVIESRTGMKLVHWDNTPDPVDFAYGVISAACGALLPKVVRSNA